MRRDEADNVAEGDDIQMWVIAEEKSDTKKLRGSRVTIHMTVEQKIKAARELAIKEGVVVQGIVDFARPSGGSILLADSNAKITYDAADVLPEKSGEIPEGKHIGYIWDIV